MELLLELFVTAFVALVFSFLVAKLVSIAMAGDDGVAGGDFGLKKASKIVENKVVMEEMKFDRGIKVEGAKSKKRVQFAVEEVVEKVHKFESEGSVGKLEELCCGEKFVEKYGGVEEVCGGGGGIEVDESGGRGGVSEGVGVSVKTTEVAADIGSGLGNDGGEVGHVEGGLVVWERKECIGGIEFCVGKEGNLAKSDLDGLVFEEKIGNKEVDDECGGNADLDGLVVEEKNDNDIDGVKLVREIVVSARSEEVRVLEVGEDQGSGVEGQLKNQEDEEKAGLVDVEDEDWEGIERSELEKDFAKAASYVDGGGKEDWLVNLGSDVHMQLYGLHKVAMEGPCHEAQPMAFKVSARAKWNAWQRLGNMSPEVAMEQYISVLSDKGPGWMQGDSAVDRNPDSLEAANPGAPNPTFLDTQPNSKKEMKLQLNSSTDGGDLTRGSTSVNTAKE